MAHDIHLTTSWARQPLPAGVAQVAYLLIEARPTLQAAASAPLTFVMVLDRSGSMDGAKIDHLKDAVMQVLGLLRPDDLVAIVVFDETAEVIVPLQPVGDAALLNNRIEAIRVQGGTAMSSGLELGLAELRRGLTPERNAHVLVLTDGQTWGDEDRCRALAAELGRLGARITALGLGDEWNEQLLDDLAAATGGTSDYIAQPQAIERVFQRVARTAQTTIIRRARLLVRLAREVTPRAVYRVRPLIANLGYTPLGEREISVDLGDVAPDTGVALLAELLLPARPAGEYRIAQAEVTYDVPSQQRLDQRVRVDVPLRLTPHTAEVQTDPALMNLVERVTAFKLQTRALEEAAAGNLAGATQKLRSAATRLLDLGELELAETMQRAAEAAAQGQLPSAADKKELTYRTRRLTLKDLTES